MTPVIQHVGALQARGRKQFVTPALCHASYCSREQWGFTHSKFVQHGQYFARLQHTELSLSSRLSIMRDQKNTPELLLHIILALGTHLYSVSPTTKTFNAIS